MPLMKAIQVAAPGAEFELVQNGPVGKEVKRILAVPEHLKIAFSVCLGYAITSTSPYLRVRRDIEDFSHHDHFGNNGMD